MKKYGIALEVSGPLGMFRRPETGSNGTSYPIPPASACTGMINSICRVRGARLTIVAVGICAEPRFTPYNFNSISILRKPALIKDEQCDQFKFTVLQNPCFQILAYATEDEGGHERYSHINHAHSFQEQFYRRIKKGQNFSPVSLGLKEFLASRVSHPQSPLVDYNYVIANLVHGKYQVEEYYKECDKNVPIRKARISNGVFRFTEDPVDISSGILQFSSPADFNLNQNA